MSRIKVLFRLEPDEDGWPPSTAETLWADPLGNDEYRLDNSPFYVRGVSNQDVVIAHEDDSDEFHRLVFSRVARRGGHSTYRFILHHGKIDDARNQKYWTQLATLGCSYEGMNGLLFSVDVPPGADVAQVYRILEEGENEDVWGFEEGHYFETITLLGNQT